LARANDLGSGRRVTTYGTGRFTDSTTPRRRRASATFDYICRRSSCLE
jgi:hypothetical protein